MAILKRIWIGKDILGMHVSQHYNQFMEVLTI